MRSGCLAVSFLLSLTGCSGPYSTPAVSAKVDEKPLAVRTQVVRPETIPEIVNVTGELLAEDQATLSAKVAGRVMKLFVDIGSRVGAGDVLAELETTDYEFRLRQAEAQVEQTRARLGLSGVSPDKVDPKDTAIVRQAAASLREATLLHQNATRLFQQGITSKVDFERAGVALMAAQARHQAAIEEVFQLQALLLERRAQVSLAQQNLTDTVIRAPFNGAITRRIASLGEFLSVNAPVVQLVRQHPIRIRVSVPERLAAKVRTGQRIDIRFEGAGEVRTGRTVRLSPSIEAQNRSLVVEGELPNEDGRLRPGSFVEAAITTDPAAQGLAIPVRSVASFAGVQRVFVLREGALDDRPIKLGRTLESGKVQVAEGLQPGDAVVLEPNDSMRAGLKAEAR